MKTPQVLLFLFLGITQFSLSAHANDPRPNILYIFVDDMGWGSIGANGQAQRREQGLPYVRTPNIDQLAASGLNFRRGYACTVCSPSRSSQQTGFHQGHTFADRNDPNNAKKAMRADDILIGDALSKAGYTTGYWGKWGYGGSKDRVAPVIDNVQTLPTSHGYQHVLAELHHVRAHTFFQPTLWHAPAKDGSVGGLELIPNTLVSFVGNDRYPNFPAQQNDREYPKTAYCDDSYAFAALDFVRENGQNYNRTGEPFFGLLAVQIPHGPFGEIIQLPHWDNAYADDPSFPKLAKQAQQWAAMVTRMDAHVGNILETLEDPNGDGDKSDSISENTLVVFQSDNGGPAGPSNNELKANGGLRGNKGKIYEGGIRVPLVMRWPKHIHATSKLKAGESTDMVVDITDLLPTFCDLAAARKPLGIDGVSIAPTLTGKGKQRKREFIIHEAGNQQSIIRGNYKLIRSNKSRIELYDLATDPTESKNLAKQNPVLAKKLETKLLAEHVTEPRGFAATYHHWVGNKESAMSNADNWSDYAYENAGVTYLSDAGPPRSSWIAAVRNTTAHDKTATADMDIELLALAIAGSPDSDSTQTVIAGESHQLVGRNEIRIEKNGKLQLDGGSASTERWIEIEEGGSLSGHGAVRGDVINRGTVSTNQTSISVEGDFEQLPGGRLALHLKRDNPSNTKNAYVRVDGNAELNGSLQLTESEIAKTQLDSITVLRAKQIRGRFDNERDQVVSNTGTRYHIVYGKNQVELRRQR